MSDGTSAGIFAELFHYAGERDDLMLIEKLWSLSDGYDFSPDDLRVEDVLAKIDVIRIGWDKDYGEWIRVYKTRWASEFDAAMPWDKDFDWDQPGPSLSGGP